MSCIGLTLFILTLFILFILFIFTITCVQQPAPLTNRTKVMITWIFEWPYAIKRLFLSPLAEA